MDLYRKVVALIKDFSVDQEVLQVIKDNATEALLIRSKRDMKSLSDSDFGNREELHAMLKKERLFFTSLIKASDFLSQRFCKALNDIKEHHIKVQVKN